MSEDGRFSHAKGRIVDNLEIKIGDIFQLDEHRVMCGDATNAEDVAALMGGGVRLRLSTQTRLTG